MHVYMSYAPMPQPSFTTRQQTI